MTEKHTMHVTMPRDKALEYLESLEKLVNDQFADMGYVVALGMAVREFRAAEPDNAPLTLEQLREMDGEPVWIATMQEWRIICVDTENGIVRLYTVFNTISAEHVYRNDGRIYRRPLEKGE